MIPEEFLNQMADRWPSAIVARTEIPRFTGGLIARRTIEKIDGPITKIKMGRKIAYRVDDVIQFIRERGEVIKPDQTVEELIAARGARR